jgi:hypothetical protein
VYVVFRGQVWTYDPVDDKWQARPGPLRTPRYHHALSAFNGKLYSFGGLQSGPTGESIQAAVEE